MKLFFSLVYLFVIAGGAISQADSALLLKQAAIRLQNHADVSTILTDKAYSRLHPLTSFREMIQKNASSNVLAITTTDEPGKKIKVVVTVRDKDGQPIANALVYASCTFIRICKNR